MRLRNICLVLAACCSTPLAFADVSKTAQLILTHGTIYSGQPSQPQFEALAVQDGKIVATGSSQDIKAWQGPATRVIDLKGQAVYPGFHEGHGHLLGVGRMLIELNLSGVPSLPDAQKKIAAEIKKTPESQWVRGRGWDQNLWPRKNFPSRQDLDTLSAKHPIVLSRVDGHALWVNSLALKAAGITRQTKDPVGGKILRDAKGEATGILLDVAMELIQKVVPERTPAQREEAIKAAIKLSVEQGITSFHDAGTDDTVIDVYQSLLDRGELPLRLNVMLDGSDEPLLQKYMKSGPISKGQDQLQIRTVKLMSDGALGSRGAALIEPYADEPGYAGLQILNEEQIYQATKRFAKAGFQTATHAIGDQANRNVLNAYERVIKEFPGQELRLRVEHAQLLNPRDIPRFGQLGILASMQPTHLTSDGPWVATRIGTARMNEGAYVWQKIRQSRGRIVSGSDAPVESLSPFLGLFAAITRQSADGKTWTVDQHLTMEEALETYTRNAAYAAFWENKLGSLETGKYADFVVLDRDLIAAAKAGQMKSIRDARVLMTVVGGRIVYQSEAAPNRS